MNFIYICFWSHLNFVVVFLGEASHGEPVPIPWIRSLAPAHSIDAPWRLVRVYLFSPSSTAALVTHPALGTATSSFSKLSFCCWMVDYVFFLLVCKISNWRLVSFLRLQRCCTPPPPPPSGVRFADLGASLLPAGCVPTITTTVDRWMCGRNFRPFFLDVTGTDSQRKRSSRTCLLPAKKKGIFGTRVEGTKRQSSLLYVNAGYCCTPPPFLRLRPSCVLWKGTAARACSGVGSLLPRKCTAWLWNARSYVARPVWRNESAMAY